MKLLIMLVLCTVLVSCGNGGGGSSAGKEQSSNPVSVACNIQLNKKDLVSIAKAANEARQECGLSEEEVVKFISSKT